ncbi:tetratricopeptide repeat protein [Cyanobacterium aponinum UTEX 3222]|uniref:tetratricopeptide repeat protein n=1 Tax=Cyanobacterium aponinum TaxID=379064 RepID=UPI002B4C1B8F|nr:tetratricopeptide repeat protein [Cyanobacterium aponinum]WRL38023.1 tetratricopeptide repeat protein [Cyanobacterium aponinum UTEX 3221]WRL41494.1 tetratricopeptide repeat protein [Cyanobacterium aponinum UTEX 3222]
MKTSKYEQGAIAFADENYQKAMEIMLPLAKEGDIKAQLSVASMYFSGLGVKQDYEKAAQWYRYGAEKGHPIAQHSLAMALFSLENIEEAIEYLLKADQQNISFAQSCLGDVFTGAYNIPNHILSKFNFGFYDGLVWYEKAGDGGFSYAYHRLGDIYAKGEVVTKNEINALKFYRKAAQEGYSPSQEVLADAYRNGLFGLPVDLEQAQYWSKKIQENENA